MRAYNIIPQDLLFFRDGRPIDTVGGHGARWPEPSLIFDAIHAALHRAFPNSDNAWEHSHRYGRSSDRDHSRNREHRFGSLTTAGLFPVDEKGNWYFPSPADYVPSESENSFYTLKPMKPIGVSNLPNPLKYTLGNPCPPSKTERSGWWSRKAFNHYFQQKPIPAGSFKTSKDFYAGEWTTGIGMDPERQTQDGERIYSAEYMRLKPDVSMGFLAALRMKQNGDPTNVQECLDKLFAESNKIIAGGQQRVCSVSHLDIDVGATLPMGGVVEGTRVKWTLLTPAIFPAIQKSTSKDGKEIVPHSGGWLPTWVAENAQLYDGEKVEPGAVLLRDGPGLAKAKRVKGVQAGKRIKANLVAACIPKPVTITGWTEAIHLIGKGYEKERTTHGPKETKLAVAAGTVYYFEAESEEQAQKLADALSWHGGKPEYGIIKNRRSTLMGEKGFGLGVCGTWDFY